MPSFPLPLALGTLTLLALPLTAPASLPPDGDPPEEVLRTEMIWEARSPLTGEPLTPAQYLELQQTLQAGEPPVPSPALRQVIFLLQLRRVVRPLLPLLP